MKIAKISKALLQNLDFFSASQFLRYKGDQDYKTATGGFCSLMVIVVFMVLFMNTAIQTVNMENIAWTSSTSTLFDPYQTSLTISPMFMFSVGILGVDLNHPSQRFFDVTLIDRHISRGNVEVESTVIKMVPCTEQHFSINREIKESFYTLPTSRWLCPPLGFSFGLHGKYTSKTMEFLQINVKKCNNTLDPTRPCASDQTIDNLERMLGQFTFSIKYVNPLINAGEKEYLSYYLQDRNYVTFTRKLGTYSNGFIEDFQIDTDISLLPLAENIIDQGTIISGPFQNIAYQVTNDNYASFYLMKSSTSTTYLRQFTKIDTFFSYVGGLVGTMLGLMVIVSKYTQFSFELDLCQRLFTYSLDKKDNLDINILSYLSYLVYCVISIFGSHKKSQKAKQSMEYRQQINKQLNLDFILQRINFIERAVEVILSRDQLQGLHLQQQSLLTLQKRRRRYKALSQMSKDLPSSSESEEQSDQSNDSNKNNSSAQINELVLNNIEASFGEIKEKSVKFEQEKKSKKGKQQILDRLRIQCEEGNQISQKILGLIPQSSTLSKEPQMVHITNKVKIEGSLDMERKVKKQDQFLFAQQN